MSILEIPARPDDITPKWLTDALRSTGAITNSRVQSLTVDPVSAGQGFVTQLAQINVNYDSPQPDAPVSLFCKIHSADESFVEYAKLSGPYIREVGFYEDLAPSTPVRTPICYYSHLDKESGTFVLLLENLEGTRPGDQVTGCNVTEAELVVKQAATFLGDGEHWKESWQPPKRSVVV